MTQASTQLQDRLQTLRLHWQVRRVVEGLLLTLAVAAALLCASSLLDFMEDLSVVGRWLAWAVMVSVILTTAWRCMAQPLRRRHGDEYFAVLAESRHSGMGNRLINAVQISRETADVSPLLLEAILEDGVEAMNQVRSSRVTRRPSMERHATALGISLLMLAAFLWLSGPGGPVALARFLQPWKVIAPFTWTTLTLAPAGDIRLLQGEPLDVAVTWAGRAPAAPAIHWTGPDGLSRSLPLSPASSSGNSFSHHFDAVQTAMTLHATGGDGRSPSLSVSLEPRPGISSLNVLVTPPAYAMLPAQSVNMATGQLAVLPGSQLAWQLVASKPLARATMVFADQSQQPLTSTSPDGLSWEGQSLIKENRHFKLILQDTLGHQVTDPAAYGMTLLRDAPPLVSIELPGRDLRLTGDQPLDLKIIASDDLGLGSVQLWVQSAADKQPRLMQTWDTAHRQATLVTRKTPAALGLTAGGSLQYWAVAADRNNITGPGVSQSQRYALSLLTPLDALVASEKQILDYSQYIGQLLKLQKTNLVQTTGHQPPGPLALRQGDIRTQTLKLIDAMQRSRFEGQSIMEELAGLTVGEMARVVAVLEKAQGMTELSQSNEQMDRSLKDQTQIITVLESILQRLDRNEAARKRLKELEKKSPQQHQQVVAALEKIIKDLDAFLVEQKKLDESYEKMPKRSSDELKGEGLLTGDDPDHRLDRWKKWSKDTVDQLAKLPTGFAKDTHLADTVSTIFEEIEKKPRLPTKEVATPLEESAKWLGTQTKEDLEMWMPDRGDNIKWVMEDPKEGKFDIPEMKLPDDLQDMVGDLIEDASEFDQDADDSTGSWGGNTPQAGWGIGDGPISSFSATGKTGNQLPNDSEITGRSGAGRRGKATGQMVGSDSAAMEGRPTPARVTNERYEEGQINAPSQLDPRGSTGGGKKTGGGQLGLQGGTPPDVVKDMARLEKNQAMLREKAQKLADALQIQGRSSSHVERAMQLFEDAQTDLRDHRYHDAARKRKTAVGELRNQQQGAQALVSLSLDKAAALPEDLRQAISAGASQPLPQGYEDLVGAYYRALSAAGDSPTPSGDKP